jgi:hypothetical protein
VAIHDMVRRCDRKGQTVLLRGVTLAQGRLLALARKPEGLELTGFERPPEDDGERERG